MLYDLKNLWDHIVEQFFVLVHSIIDFITHIITYEANLNSEEAVLLSNMQPEENIEQNAYLPYSINHTTPSYSNERKSYKAFEKEITSSFNERKACKVKKPRKTSPVYQATNKKNNTLNEVRKEEPKHVPDKKQTDEIRLSHHNEPPKPTRLKISNYMPKVAKTDADDETYIKRKKIVNQHIPFECDQKVNNFNINIKKTNDNNNSIINNDKNDKNENNASSVKDNNIEIKKNKPKNASSYKPRVCPIISEYCTANNHNNHCDNHKYENHKYDNHKCDNDDHDYANVFQAKHDNFNKNNNNNNKDDDSDFDLEQNDELTSKASNVGKKIAVSRNEIFEFSYKDQKEKFNFNVTQTLGDVLDQIKSRLNIMDSGDVTFFVKNNKMPQEIKTDVIFETFIGKEIYVESNVSNEVANLNSYSFLILPDDKFSLSFENGANIAAVKRKIAEREEVEFDCVSIFFAGKKLRNVILPEKIKLNGGHFLVHVKRDIELFLKSVK